MLRVIMLNVFMVSVFMPSVVLMNVFMPSVVKLNVFMMSVVMLNVFMLSVVAPSLILPLIAFNIFGLFMLSKHLKLYHKLIMPNAQSFRNNNILSNLFSFCQIISLLAIS